MANSRQRYCENCSQFRHMIRRVCFVIKCRNSCNCLPGIEITLGPDERRTRHETTTRPYEDKTDTAHFENNPLLNRER